MNRKLSWISAFLLSAFGLAVLLLSWPKSVTLIVDGQAARITSTAWTVASLLKAQNLAAGSHDELHPAARSLLHNRQTILLNHAVAVTLDAGGRTVQIFTTERRPANILALAGFSLFPEDRILLDGKAADPAQPFPVAKQVHIELKTALSFIVKDENGTQQYWSAADTIGEALAENGVHLQAADRVTPDRDSVLSSQINVQIQHARQVKVISPYGESTALVAADTVGQALALAGLPLQGLDFSQPADDQPLPDDGVIQINHVEEKVLLEQTPLPFDSLQQPLPDLEIDQQQIVQVGAYGLQISRVRVRSQNGKEVSRQTEQKWIAKEPKPRILGYGTNIVVRALETPDGAFQYWRAVRMYATSYSPCGSAGVPGVCYPKTYSEKPVQKGVAAFTRDMYWWFAGSKVYVPGYGIASIEDIGGGVPGRLWIDLGYSDEDWVSWHSWVTVYFLTPVPAPDDILWILE